MGQTVELKAADGHTLAAYRADPAGQPQGAVVVIQEVFGVNPHVREVADGYAAAGYTAIAPALFDRYEPGIELGYTEQDIARARELAFPLGWEKPILDLGAAVAAVSSSGKVGTVGYCWGGSLAYLSACKLPVQAAVGYYGGQITRILEEVDDPTPKVPTMLHFGTQDAGIPLEDVETVRKALPDVPIHMYEAGHGFNCDHRASYDEAATKLALERTLEFFRANLAP